MAKRGSGFTPSAGAWAGKKGKKSKISFLPINEVALVPNGGFGG